MRNIILISILMFAFKAHAYKIDANCNKPYVDIADTTWGDAGYTAKRLYLYHVDGEDVVTMSLGDGVTYFPLIAVKSYKLTEQEYADWVSTDTDGKFVIIADIYGLTITDY